MYAPPSVRICMSVCACHVHTYTYSYKYIHECMHDFSGARVNILLTCTLNVLAGIAYTKMKSKTKMKISSGTGSL